ncbi:MAG: tyrosine--tRNA ligase [Halococcoides sp.]
MTDDTIVAAAEEVVTDEEFEALIDDPEGRRVYVGYEPSGVLHVGHLITANALIDLQAAGFEVVVLLADVHAYLNGKGTFEAIRDTAERMREQFLAYGLDPDRTEFVLGSEFQFEETYVLDVFELATTTSLSRAERAMAELQSGQTATVGHVLYPLMQALDIVHLDVDLAVGGLDQRKVHMLARDELPAIGYDAPTCLHTPILGDLSTGEGKMSASEGETISMEDDRETIERKVNDAFCPPERDPEGELVNPVLELFEYQIFPRFDRVVVDRPEEYGGDLSYDACAALADDLDAGELHPQDAKSALAEYLDRLIAPGRERLAELRAA